MTMTKFVNVENVEKYFGKSQVLRGVSFQMRPQEQCVICGASGSGKSTLLHLLGGLDRPTQGQIWVQQKNLALLDDDELAYFRNRVVGFVFQFHYLLPSMNCWDNILLPARIGQASLKDVSAWANSMAVRLGVDHCLKKFPYEISGGEQQRINIVRALSLRPQLLLCDEPTGNLDTENSRKVIELIGAVTKEYKSALVMVTHDLQMARNFQRRLTMVDGILREETP